MKKRKRLKRAFLAVAVAISLLAANMSGLIPYIYAASNETSEDAPEPPLKRPLRYLLTGNGTASDPYQIWDEEDLRDAWQMGLASHFVLKNDIELTYGWTPIGATSAKPFTGIFDGQGYSISNIQITGGNNLGFFGFLNKATVRNLTLEDVTFQGTSTYLGGLAGFVSNASLISNCVVKNSTVSHMDTAVQGSIGGLVGRIDNSTIQNSHVERATVSGKFATNNMGGFAGVVVSSTITNSYVTNPAVQSSTKVDSIGGFAGYVATSTISQSYVTDANVTSNGVAFGAGGFLGRSQGGTYSECFSTGIVDLVGYQAHAGGFIGKVEGVRAAFKISDCFSTCDVITLTNNLTSTYYVGGFAGHVSGTINTAGDSVSATYNSSITKVYASGTVRGNNASGLFGYAVGQYYKQNASVTDVHNIALSNNVALASKVTTSLANPYRVIAAMGSYATLANNYGLREGEYYGTGEGLFSDPTQEYDNLKSGQTITIRDAKRKITYMSQATWAFNTIWAIDEGNGIPYLQFSGDISHGTLPGDPEVVLPEKPNNLLVTEKNGDLVLSWGKVFGATEYDVYINDTPYTTANTYFTLKSDVVPTDIVTAYVIAKNAAGSGPRSVKVTLEF